MAPDTLPPQRHHSWTRIQVILAPCNEVKLSIHCNICFPPNENNEIRIAIVPFIVQCSGNSQPSRIGWLSRGSRFRNDKSSSKTLHLSRRSLETRGGAHEDVITIEAEHRKLSTSSQNRTNCEDHKYVDGGSRYWQEVQIPELRLWLPDTG